MALTNPLTEAETLTPLQQRQLEALAKLRELLPLYEQSPDPHLRARIEQLTKLLPTEDDIPMENFWHVLQMHLLIELTNRHWHDRDDYFAAGNVFVYYSVEQAEGVVRNRQTTYRGPDFFIVTGIDGRKERDSWVVWLEGKYPDLIVEFLSDTTAETDKNIKKDIYEQTFRTREYYWYDGFTGEFVGLELVKGKYQPKAPNARGWYWSEVLGAWLGVHRSSYQRRVFDWLRLFDREGNLIPTDEEWARQEQRLREQEAQRAERAEAELERLRQRLREAGLEE